MKSKDYCDYCDHADCNPERGFRCWDGINFNGIELIPIEQVASMLETIAQNTCPIEVIGMDKTEWCIEQNCFDRFFNENCWIHAIKEGWLK